jgi:regulator of protease activity HflC (stomatin/prohibitin superfamily)
MFFIKRVKIRSFEKGFCFKNGEFRKILDHGSYWAVKPFLREKIDVMSMREPWILHTDLDLVVKSGALKNDSVVLDLKDDQRALVWIDGRLDSVLAPGLHALWTKFRDIKTEVIDVTNVRLIHDSLELISKARGATEMFNVALVEEGYKGVYFLGGEFIETLDPGKYLFWKDFGKVKVYHVDLREKVLDISRQEIITADKVTLRMNTVVTYRVTDALKSVTASEDAKQAVYREAQLALRAVVGTFSLDALLTDKDTVAGDLEKVIRDRASDFGIQIISLGIRDVILPGEMKNLMNKVIEAKKVADANLIMRREETAAMRSQANTARILESNPTLMRLRELDVLEKIAGNSKLNVVLGEKGLADRVVNLL